MELLVFASRHFKPKIGPRLCPPISIFYSRLWASVAGGGSRPRSEAPSRACLHGNDDEASSRQGPNQWRLYLMYPRFFFQVHSPSSSFALSLLLTVVTQIRGHIAGSSPSLPAMVCALIFIARRVQLFLPSSTRVELLTRFISFVSS